MNLRKIFNIPNNVQQKLLDDDYERLEILADTESYKYNYLLDSDIFVMWVRHCMYCAQGKNYLGYGQTQEFLINHGFYAETIKRKVNNYGCYGSDILTLIYLRSHYKSVYDK